MLPHRHRGSLGLLVVLVFSASVWVAAAGPGEPLRAIPYRGVLEIGGLAYTGTASMVFRLYDDPVADAVWTSDEPEQIPVTAGAFGVLIGQNDATLMVPNPIPDALFNAAELYLSVEVNGATLAGRQRIAAVPMAVRSSRAYDLDVAETLTARNVDVTEAVTAGSVDVGAGNVSAGNVSAATVDAATSVATGIVTATTGAFDDATFSGDVSTGTVAVQRGDAAAFRTVRFSVEFASGASNQTGTAACGGANGHCLQCFGDSPTHPTFGCGASGSNRNCLCAIPD